ncbi:tRNA glutamyl-Q(34) synthetase GluQRS [Sphingomonas sp. KR1UV-12]|uniref:tRNA glutamyl-Q(34) synthetase GluQRS n=1 Tax=Sphingomonas aurea TaxID=3063994 RepID=A0ABT9EM12_9SPHN|nr:tRNA glutamyl-Q(34) synthetase GluQRS [Sphingomonas sp. KR1UV-12]MDP1028005.1 tRNA glutamyl-Q(34) synthetase GluQRS [Sphingomonas sp. KR1UV-12]
MIRGQEEQVVSRFAPSPTGRLHLGHALSAIRAHDLASAAGGRFLLRIEDIDGTRSRAEHVATILDDLAWLGLRHEPPVFQSERLALYDTALAELRTRGLVYPCFCTRAEIAASASAPHGPVAAYPGTCRPLAPAAAAARMGEAHCWRLDLARALAQPGMADEDLWWHDAAAGRVRADPASQGDVVLARKDAPASYHLAVTVDDAAQGVTDVVRGVDLFDATHVHRLLQALLGLPTPRYHHHPLLTGADGQRLAKRHGSPTLAAMRAAGVDGKSVADDLRNGRLPTGFSVANA